MTAAELRAEVARLRSELAGVNKHNARLLVQLFDAQQNVQALKATVAELQDAIHVISHLSVRDDRTFPSTLIRH